MGNTCSAWYSNFFKKTKDGNYLIKIDELQIDRIQQQHHVLKSCCETNFFPPISQDLARGIEVLDVGSGPGTWVFDMSSEFQKSKFTGIEIQSFMLPEIQPSNTRFIHNDILKGIPFDPNSFDYIHMRCMTLCFTESQYEQVIRNLVDLLKPNGFLELCEPQLHFHNMGPATQRIMEEVGKFLRKKSMDPLINNRLKEFMENSGLREIEQHEIMIPLSTLDGEVGSLMGQSAIIALSALKGQLAKQMKISSCEINQLFNQFIVETKLIRMYCKYTRVYGKKYK